MKNISRYSVSGLIAGLLLTATLGAVVLIQADLLGQFKQMNVKMRTDTTKLINESARSHGFSIDSKSLIVSSMAPELIVAGSPVEGIRGKGKKGNQAAEAGGAKSDIIGLFVVAGTGAGNPGKHGKQGGSKRALGGAIAGIYMVKGNVAEGASTIQVVGMDGKVLTKVKVNTSWASSKNDWWKPVYMSILQGLTSPAAGKKSGGNNPLK